MTTEITGKEESNDSHSLNRTKSISWIISLIAFSILLIAFSLRLINNADIGFHLKGGQWIIENMKFPSNDVFTYTVNNHQYIDMQWLYQVLVFGVQSIFGYAALTFLNVILIFIVFYLLYRVMQFREVPLPLIVVSLFLVLLVIQFRFSYRPELMSWIGIMLTLFIMEMYYFSKKKNLYFLPIVMLVWVNMHGLFIIGLFMIACYVISIWVRDKKPDLYLLKWFGIAVLATLINPYFITGATYPFYLLTRLDESNIFAQTIFELKSPIGLADFSNLHLELMLYYGTAILSAVFFIITIKKRKVHEFIILLAFFYISYAAIRNVPIFMFYGGFIIALCLTEILKFDFFRKIFGKLKPVSSALAYISAIAFLLLTARIVTGNYYNGYGAGVDFGVGLNKKSFPIDALRFLENNALKGRIINDLGYGGWLDWQYPNQVFIDGRLEVIKEDLYREYVDAVNNGKLAELLKKYNPQLVIFNHGSTISWISQMKEIPEWRLIYLDDNTAVFGKREGLEKVSMNNIIQFFENEGFTVLYNEDDINRILDIEPGLTTGDWFDGFYKPHKQYRNMINFALFCLDITRYKEAEMTYLNIIDKTNGKLDDATLAELYFNLGTLYQLNGDNIKAMKCYTYSLKFNPSNTMLIQRIKDYGLDK